MVYYPIPLHQQKAFNGEGIIDDLTNTTKLCEQVLSIPIHSEMEEETAKYIAETLLEILIQNG